MFSIFSTQNLQTFLRRKYLRPPSRGPPGPPPGRGPREGGRWLCPSVAAGASAVAAGAFVSSAMMLLHFVARTLLSAAFDFNCGADTLVRQLRALDGRWRSFSALCRGRRGRRRLLAGVANGLDLVEALLLFVDADADELDHGFGHAQAALEFVDQAAAAFDGEQDVDAIMKTANGVGQTAFPHA